MAELIRVVFEREDRVSVVYNNDDGHRVELLVEPDEAFNDFADHVLDLCAEHDAEHGEAIRASLESQSEK